MPVDLKSIAPDTTLPQSGFLFGADSQEASNPSVYPVANVKDALNSGIGTLASEPAITWDTAANPTATVTLTTNATLYASNFKAGGTYKLIVFQDATGGRTLAYDPNFKWPNDTIPTVSSGANAMTVFEFVSNGVYLYGTVSQAYDGSPAPTVMGMFARPANDYTTISTLSSMPTGGAVSRASQAMQYDSTGRLTWAPNNVCQRSQEFNDAYWSKISASVTPNTAVAPDGTTTADTLTATAANGEILRSTNAGAGTYILSVWIKRKTGTGQIQFVSLDGSRVNVAQTVTSTDWTRCFLRDTGTLSNAYIGVRLVTSGDEVYLWGAQLEAVTYQTSPRDYLPTTDAARFEPRFDVDPATGQAKGLLVEGARTNLFTRSQQFGNGIWIPGSISVTEDQITAPDGTLTADLITATATGTLGLLRQVLTLNSTADYTVSVYAKSGTSNILCISPTDGTDGSRHWFNLTTGTIGSTVAIGAGFAPVSASIANVGNGWFRCAMTFRTRSVTSISLFFSECDADASLNVTTGKTIYLWGAQLEAGAWASSYLPTGASTLARLADTFTLSGYANRLVEAYWIEQETGVASSFPETVVSSGAVTINPPQFGWVTSLRAYQNAYAGDIATPSWIDNSGTNGNRMVTDSTGTLTWAPANMLLQSNFAASWSAVSATTTPGQTAPDGSTNAALLTTTANGGYINQTVSTVSDGSTVIVSLYVKKSNVDFFLIRFRDRANVQHSAWFNINTGTAGSTSGTASSLTVTPADNGFFRISAAFAASSGVTNPFVLLWPCATNSGTSANGDAAIIFGAQLEQVTYQTQPRAYIPTTSAAVFMPRYDFDGSTTPASPRGMLIEEGRQNAFGYSQQMDTLWSLGGYQAFGSGSIANATVAPDGTVTADQLTESTAASTQFFVAQGGSVSAAASYCLSFYIKRAVGARDFYIQVNLSGGTTGAGFAWFNLTTGTASTVTTLSGTFVGGTPTINYVGNGWYRCALPFTTNAGNNTITTYAGSYNSARVYSGDGLSSLYIWGAQLEAGSLTSYIPTTTGSVERRPDVVKLTGAALTTMQGPNVSALVQTTPWSASSSLTSYGTLGAGGSARLIYGAASGNTTVQTYNGTSATTATIGGGATVNGSITRAGVSWNTAGGTNSVSLVANNGTVGNSAATFTVGAPVYLGAYVSGGGFGGCVQSVALYNSRLPDATLQKKSAVGAAY